MKKFMVKFVILTCIVMICVVFLNMCGAENNAKRLIKSKGYKIISKLGRVHEYTLTNNLLNDEKDWWQIHKIKPGDYIGKKIEVYGFIVKNHPLDSVKINDKKQTRVFVMVCEGKIIGGASAPDTTELYVGRRAYTLEGKEYGK